MRLCNDGFQVQPKGYSCAALDLPHRHSWKVYFKQKLTNVLSCFLRLSLNRAAVRGSQLLTDKQWKVIGARPVEITQNCFSRDLQIITGSGVYRFQPVAIHQKVFIEILSEWKQNVVVLEEKPWRNCFGDIRTKMDIKLIWFVTKP